MAHAAEDEPSLFQVSSCRASPSPPLGSTLAAANLVEPGYKALVVNSGYFSERMGAILDGASRNDLSGRHLLRASVMSAWWP